MVKTLPVIAGDAGSIPGLGAWIAHALGRLTRGPQPLSLSFRGHVLERLKPALLKPALGNKRRHRHGKPELHAGSSPCSPRLEKTYAQKQRPSTAISQSLKQKMQLDSLKMAEAGLEKAMEAPGTVAGVGSTHMGQRPVLQPRWVQGRRAQGSATEGPEAAPHLGREPAGGQAR